MAPAALIGVRASLSQSSVIIQLPLGREAGVSTLVDAVTELSLVDAVTEFISRSRRRVGFGWVLRLCQACVGQSGLPGAARAHFFLPGTAHWSGLDPSKRLRNGPGMLPD